MSELINPNWYEQDYNEYYNEQPTEYTEEDYYYNNEYSNYDSYDDQPNGTSTGYYYEKYAEKYNFLNSYNRSQDFINEPPLLEELEIYPERIFEKSIVVLNPFHDIADKYSTEDFFREHDLAGPILFCFTLAVLVFLSGGKPNFSYIYVLSLLSVFFIYILLSLMSTDKQSPVSVMAVASTLGYGILPITGLALLAFFISMPSFFGVLMTLLAVTLSSISASRTFCHMNGEHQQQYLIGYPCMLIYFTFAMLIHFC